MLNDAADSSKLIVSSLAKVQKVIGLFEPPKDGSSSIAISSFTSSVVLALEVSRSHQQISNFL